MVSAGMDWATVLIMTSLFAWDYSFSSYPDNHSPYDAFDSRLLVQTPNDKVKYVKWHLDPFSNSTSTPNSFFFFPIFMWYDRSLPIYCITLDDFTS